MASCIRLDRPLIDNRYRSVTGIENAINIYKNKKKIKIN